jgi:hypothetical protein
MSHHGGRAVTVNISGSAWIPLPVLGGRDMGHLVRHLFRVPIGNHELAHLVRDINLRHNILIREWRTDYWDQTVELQIG